MSTCTIHWFRRDLRLADYNLRTEEICVVAHHDYGISINDSHHILTMVHERGISHHTINTLRYAVIVFESWLKVFDNVAASVAIQCQLSKTTRCCRKMCLSTA